jgi:hypothetical protein
MDRGNTPWNIWVAIAGTEFAQAVKDGGWKGAPTIAWNAMRHGTDIEATD